jgi:hypothetical protein
LKFRGGGGSGIFDTNAKASQSDIYTEYEDVLARASLFQKSRLTEMEREELFDIF